MDHRTFIASLSATEKADLTQASDPKGLLHLAGHISVLTVGATWIAQGWPLWWAMMIPHGIALVFLFTLEHECTHKTPFANKTVNEWVGRICGVLIILPFEWFRYFHLAHHRWTNIAGKDPEIAHPRPETPAQFAWFLTGLSYWWAMVLQVWRNAFGDFSADYLPERTHPRVQGEARWMIAIYAGALVSLFFTPTLLWIWIIPALLGQPFLRLYTLAEHGRCPQVADMFLNTRTTITNRIVRFLAWNMPYHAEHHAYPSVPFHKLPDLHEKVQDHLAVKADGYTQFAKEYAGNLTRD